MHGATSGLALRLGLISGAAVALLCAVYVAVRSVGLLTLPSPDRQIQEPWFTLMEVLILAIAPAMVALAVALHAASAPEHRSLALLGVVFLTNRSTGVSEFLFRRRADRIRKRSSEEHQ